jgi:hypothetical protein
MNRDQLTAKITQALADTPATKAPAKAPTLTLYALADEWREIDAALDDSAGEITEEIQARIDAVEQGTGRKIDAIGTLRAESKARQAAYREEVERLRRMVAAEERKQEWQDAYVRRCLEAAGVEKFKGDRFTARVQRNGTPSVKATVEPLSLPEEFQVWTVEANKKAALEHYREHGVAPECFTIDVGTHVRIG